MSQSVIARTLKQSCRLEVNMALTGLLQGTYLASGFIRGASKVQRACVCGCTPHCEPHPLRLILIHSPVVGVRVHVGERLIELKGAHRLDVVLPANYVGQYIGSEGKGGASCPAGQSASCIASARQSDGRYCQ